MCHGPAANLSQPSLLLGGCSSGVSKVAQILLERSQLRLEKESLGEGDFVTSKNARDRLIKAISRPIVQMSEQNHSLFRLERSKYVQERQENLVSLTHSQSHDWSVLPKMKGGGRS